MNGKVRSGLYLNIQSIKNHSVFLNANGVILYFLMKILLQFFRNKGDKCRKNRQGSGSHAEKFDKRVDHSKYAAVRGSAHMWKSVTADVQYRGHMDRWKIFRGGRTGGSRFFLYADGIPDFDHTGALYGKRGGCLHTVWRRKGKETAAERVFVVCADRRDLYCFKRVGFCGNGRDPFYTSGAGRDPAAYERIFKDHIFRDHCDIFL